MSATPPRSSDVKGARILALLGDSITTDHISPAGAIAEDSPAGSYLQANGVRKQDFNSYGSRRGNHEVMMRGTFANIRIRNEIAEGREGGYTTHVPSGDVAPIYDVAMRYQAEGTPLVVVGGKEYGTGSSRDWAAKGTILLGVRAVIAESFERIHRSNLAGMGVLPLTFPDGVTRKTLGLKGDETVDIEGLEGELNPRQTVRCTIARPDGSRDTLELRCRLDTADEVDFFHHGGILQKVVRDMAG
jgi:aconitate hydratase